MKVKTEDVLEHVTNTGNKVVIAVGADDRLYVNGKAVVTEIKLASYTNAAVVLGGFATLGMFFLELCKVFFK